MTGACALDAAECGYVVAAGPALAEGADFSVFATTPPEGSLLQFESDRVFGELGQLGTCELRVLSEGPESTAPIVLGKTTNVPALRIQALGPDELLS